MPTVLIDGMNVAMARVPEYVTDAAEKKSLALEGLASCLDYFRVRSVATKVFAPRGFVEGHRPEIEPLERAGVLFSTPGGLDDHFLLQHADERGSFVVSNDRFNDHIRDRGYSKRWLDFHRIPFMFNPEFSPEPDAVVRLFSGNEMPGQARRLGSGTTTTTTTTTTTAAAKKNDNHKERTNDKNDSTLDDRKVSFPVARSTVGRIIGRRGATVKRLEAEHGVKVQLDDDDDDENGDDDLSLVTIEARGTTQSAKRLAACVDDVQRIVARALGFQVARDDLREKQPEHFDDYDAMDISS